MTTRKIQIRRGTSAQWASANTVLAAGEWGYDTDLKISKIGDGTTAWGDLPALKGSLPYSEYLTGGTESNMAGWLAARDSGVGNVLVLGTSHPYGWGTADPSNDAWPFRLAAKIGAARGMEPLNKFSTEIAQKRSYITVAGSVDRKYDTCVADMGYIDLEGGTGEISYTATCTEFRLIMRDWGGTVQYTIDGGTPQTLVGTSVDSWPKQYVIPAGASGTHTLRLYSSGGADPEVRMIALGGSGSGITVHNFGIPGTQSVNWRKDTGNSPAYMQDGTVSKPAASNSNTGQKWASLVNSVGIIQPDLLVLQIGGGNDTVATIDPVTYGQQLDYIIKWSRGQHSGQTPRSQSIIAITPFTDDATTRELRAQMEAVCASNNVPVFDADALIPDGSPMWGGGHINTAGHELIAEEMSKALMNPLAVPVASKAYVDAADAVLESSLAGKAEIAHTHTQSQVTNLTSDLASKASLSGATFTGDVVVGKATGTISNSGSGLTRIIASSSDGSARVEARTVSGQSSAFMLSTGSLPRWTVQKGTGAESGSNAGADLQVVAYDDAGAQLSVPVTVTRSTGNLSLGTGIDYGNAALQKVKLGGTIIKRAQVGSSYNGLEIKDGNDATNVDIRLDGSSFWKGPLTVDMATPTISLGTSGPRVMAGTGSPEGVVTAPPGSTFTQTNATNDVKGWIRWNKATGTGSSGWVVGPEYDTGWRDMTAVALLNGWTAGSRLQLRRLGNTVRYNGFVNAAAATNRVFYFLPAGFRPANWEYLTVLYGTTIVKALETYLDGQMSIYSYGPGDHYISTSWLTTNAAPATLPGTL